MFIAAVFTTARTWKQHTYPLTDEWIKNLWYNNMVQYNRILFSHKIEHICVSSNEVHGLKAIIQSEVSQKKKKKCILMHIYGIWKEGTDEIICRAVMSGHVWM